MVGRMLVWFLVVLAACEARQGRAQERLFTIIPKANFTTGSQLFPSPNSSDEIKRATYLPIDDIYGFGLDVRFRIPESNISFGLSADYIRTTTSQTRRVFPQLSIPIEDGYRVIPVELTGYFLIPVSGQTWGVYMGGGAGVYFGRRIYRYAEVDAPATNEGHGFGIHVLGGLSYGVADWFAVHVEMKFRDHQFEATNAFSASQTSYRGQLVDLPDPGEARVNTNGIVFQIGTAFSF